MTAKDAGIYSRRFSHEHDLARIPGTPYTILGRDGDQPCLRWVLAAILVEKRFHRQGVMRGKVSYLLPFATSP